MKLKKKGFTLVEILIATALTSLIFVGMMGATMAYLKIWKMTSGGDLDRKFNQETVVRRTLSNEMSTIIAGLNNVLANNTLTFRQLNGQEAIEGNPAEKICLYWQSTNKLPFVNDDKGGITECWLKYMGQRKSDELKGTLAALRLYYRTWKPGEKPNFNDTTNEVMDYVELLPNCVGINFGYTESLTSSPDIGFYGTPKFRSSQTGNRPDLPEVVQILISDEPITSNPNP
ncbi:MAG: prepilin-type N-terminal cleavage/methylation domain-containing protein [Puniceicoccales bacterium]|jgi:prepilin-type N-terminal cleavage/methylation domain-containing protein|nr:prepilin-type N-terminal cleavage/methylation domain-containing protein [Puniceicoccales bacterium]